jgi:hypothetical protein
VMAERCRPLSDRCPDPADHRFETEAMFVAGEDVDPRAGMVQACFFKDIVEFF